MSASTVRFAHPAPAWITLALDARGLDGPEVDAACGVAEPVVDLWEAGVLLPTPEQVGRLAFLTGQTPPYFYERTAAPTGRVFICGRRKELRSVVEPGELGPPVCPGCGLVCWLKVPAKTGGEVLLEGPDVNGGLIMCVVGRAGRGRTRRLVWGVRRAGKDERQEPHLLRAQHVCRPGTARRENTAPDTALFSRPQ